MSLQLNALATVAILGVGLVGSPLTASAQSVAVSADTRSIYAGLPFSLVVEASGYDEDPEPSAPDLKIDGCSVLYVGSSPRVVRSTSIVDGRRSDRLKVTFVYRYQITPSAAGTYKIPPLEVVQGAKEAKSPQRSFSAKSVAKSDKMALRIVLPDRPVWLGETFEVSVDWYLAADPSQPSFGIPLFGRSDWVAVKPAEQATRRRQSLTFNVGADEIEVPYSQKKVELDGQPFSRLRFRTLVTPLKAGTLELPAAKVVAPLEVGKTRDRFGFPVAKNEVFAAEDKPRTLTIKSLPQAGKPAGFRNAVGTGFSIDVQASRTVVRVGDPIELTVTVKSETRLVGMALPDLNVLLDPSQFTVGADEPVGELSDDGHTKLFKVTAQLKSSEVREVPPLELAFFNPQEGAYEKARSQPIALQVAGSAMVGAAQVTRQTDGRDGGQANPGVVSMVGADLALSKPSDTFVKPAAMSGLVPLLAALYAVPCLLLGFMTWRRRTAGARAAVGVRKKRVSAFDKAYEASASAPAKNAAAELASVLRSMKKQRGSAPDGYDTLIADLDAEAYNPRGKTKPLDSALRDRCARVGSSLLAGLALVVVLVVPGLVRAETALDQARATYQRAIGVEVGEADKETRQLLSNAATQFAAAAAEKPDRPELLADWGNAALGAHDLGWAVLAYRRALAIDRGNQRARGNLAWVRGGLPSWAPKPSNAGALASLFFWHADWSLVRRHLVAALAFALAILLLVPWRRKRPLWMIAVSGCCFVVVVAMLASVAFEPSRDADAVVVRDAETLRAADSPGAAAALSRPLPAGLEVTIVETRDRWAQVELADGQRGWLPVAAIEPVIQR